MSKIRYIDIKRQKQIVSICRFIIGMKTSFSHN